jgi:hypothetical protein
MIEVEIRTPIWKSRSVGIAESKIVDDLCIKISYKDKSGNYLYPGQYFIKKKKALSYPVQDLGKIRLRIIPIKDLEVLPKWGQPLN